MASAFYLKECASTNDEIVRFLPKEKPVVQAVFTFNQTKGKGQYGNSWESPENQNLAYSIAVPLEKLSIRGSLFNFHTAVVLADFLAILTKIKPEIKWPNDIIIKNKKISGILTEKKTVGKVPYYIVGIGLNALQENFSHLPKAGSLLTQTGKKFELESLAYSLHEYLEKHLIADISKDELLEKFNADLYRKEVVSFFKIGEIRQNGIIKYADKDGFLWVDLENDGLQKFYHKEIEMLY